MGDGTQENPLGNAAAADRKKRFRASDCVRESPSCTDRPLQKPEEEKCGLRPRSGGHQQACATLIVRRTVAGAGRSNGLARGVARSGLCPYLELRGD